MHSYKIFTQVAFTFFLPSEIGGVSLEIYFDITIVSQYGMYNLYKKPRFDFLLYCLFKLLFICNGIENIYQLPRRNKNFTCSETSYCRN